MYDMKFKTERYPVKNTSPAVDLYLKDNEGNPTEDLIKLYDRWGTGVTKFGWAEPVSMRGGISAITVAMIRNVPEEQLLKIYFKKVTQRILDSIARVSLS